MINELNRTAAASKVEARGTTLDNKTTDRKARDSDVDRSPHAVPCNLDSDWSDELVPVAERIVRPHAQKFQRTTNVASDTGRREHRPLSLGIRIRGAGYLKYWSEITFRTERPTGRDTEFDRIFRFGMYDWFLYAHANAARDGLLFWALINLSELRREHKQGNIRCDTKVNWDQTEFTTLEIWPLREPAILIAWDAIEQIVEQHIVPDMGSRKDKIWFSKRCKYGLIDTVTLDSMGRDE